MKIVAPLQSSSGHRPAAHHHFQREFGNGRVELSESHSRPDAGRIFGSSERVDGRLLLVHSTDRSFLIGWIDWRWMRISESENHLLVIALLLALVYARASVIGPRADVILPQPSDASLDE